MYLSGRIFKYMDCRMKTKNKQGVENYTYTIKCVKTGEIKKIHLNLLGYP